MNDDLEHLVARFLAEKEQGSTTTPDQFASEHSGVHGLRESILGALEVLDLFPGDPGAAPAEIGGYRVIREIGRGGMGIVYEVERGGRRYALKHLPLSPVLGARALHRFRRETIALQRLEHSNIVSVHDSGIDREVPWIVMDLVEGCPLSTQVGSLTPAESARMLSALAAAAAAAHGAGILHRDLKPKNVIVRDDGTPVLLDFGLAADDQQESLTSTGEVFGTPRYMAPEQAEGKATDARTDVHGLGLLLYETSTGRPAFGDGTRASVLRSVADGRFQPPRKIRRDLPRDLERVILTAMATDPAHRYATADELHADLERFLADRPVRGRPPGPVARWRRLAQRNPVAAVAAGTVLLLAILGTAALLGPRAPTTDDVLRAREVADRGVSRWLDGDPATASAAFHEALQLDPASGVSRVLLARLEGKPAGDDPLSLHLNAALDEAEAGEPDRALPHLGEVARHDPESSLLSFLEGSAALDLGDLVTAERELLVASRRMPDCARAARELGDAFRLRGDPGSAVEAYRRSIDMEPDSAETWKNLAHALKQLGDLRAGIDAIRRASRLLGGENASVLVVQAEILDEAGEREEARGILRRVLDRDPGDREARRRLALSLDTDHRIAQAASEYERALEANPGDPFLLVCLANLRAGADRGQCKACDAAFAAAPEIIDFERAEALLLAALDADRGKDLRLQMTFEHVIRKIPHRDRIVARIEALAREEPRTAATLRMGTLLRRVRIMEGNGD